MLWLFLFIFGLAIGSFLNVVALRYDGEHFLFSEKKIGGRSHCPHCKKTLRWFELIPLVSFAIQGGRCRNCAARIGWRYPIMELLSGVIFVVVPLYFSVISPSSSVLLSSVSSSFIVSSVIWIIVFELLLLLAYIDILLGVIPDELNIALIITGVLATWFAGGGSLWINHIAAAAAAAAFFGALVAATRGKGMGMGDVKLAFPLGLLFGWPNIILVVLLAFVIGGVSGLALIAAGKKTMKSAVPFGPFLVISATIAFFWGPAIINWYFHVIGL